MVKSICETEEGYSKEKTELGTKIIFLDAQVVVGREGTER